MTKHDVDRFKGRESKLKAVEMDGLIKQVIETTEKAYAKGAIDQDDFDDLVARFMFV